MDTLYQKLSSVTKTRTATSTLKIRYFLRKKNKAREEIIMPIFLRLFRLHNLTRLATFINEYLRHTVCLCTFYITVTTTETLHSSFLT
jgi:hypothetical protein